MLVIYKMEVVGTKLREAVTQGNCVTSFGSAFHQAGTTAEKALAPVEAS